MKYRSPRVSRRKLPSKNLKLKKRLRRFPKRREKLRLMPRKLRRKI
jgi:hypothetical protein